MAANLKAFNIENFQSLRHDKPQSELIISDLVTKKTSILNVVESLAVILTNEDKEVRREGVEFLGWLLSRLPFDFLMENELAYFSAFFCDRLVDHHSVIPAALQGILSLFKIGKLPEASVGDIIHKIFQFVTCQAQLAQDRKTMYEIFKTCSETHASIAKIGPDFLYGVLTSMEGETDPQNLLFLFSFLPSLIVKLDIEHLTENLFEVLSIYFPVDFTTVKKDNVVITRDDLSEGLGKCLSATPKLSAESLPLILEKLDSTLKVAKIDSYVLLQRCCLNIKAPDLESSLQPLWKTIQRDLIPVMDDGIQTEALKALSSIISALNSSETLLNKFLDDVVIAIRSFIGNPVDSLFPPAMKILEAMNNRSPIATKRVFLELETLCRPQKTSRTDSELLALISALTPFITTGNNSPTELPLLCFKAISCVSLQLKAAGFVAVEKLFAGLTADLQHCLFQELITVIQSSTSITPECRRLLQTIAANHSSDFLQFFNELEELLNTGKLSVAVFLQVSETVVHNPIVTDRILRHYVNFGQNEQATSAFDSLIVSCENAPVDYLRKLYDTVLTLIAANQQSANLSRLAHLLKNVLACQTAAEQTLMLNSGHLFPSIFENASVILIEGALSALRPEIRDPRFMVLTTKCILIAKTSSDLEERESAGRLLGTFVNKLPEDESKKILNSVNADLIDGNSVSLFGWCLKGAILRGFPGLDAFLTQWFGLLESPIASRFVASATGKFLNYETVFLNESCHCTIKLLYKQRLFSYLPRLVKCLPTTEDPSLRNNYLLAALQLAVAVPLQVLLTEESSVAAAVSQALQTNDPSVSQPSLELLMKLLQERSALFSDHITSLLPILLKLVHLPSSLTIRRLSLQCLFLAGFYPTHLTLPYRTEVIRELLSCLDDRKRIVRCEAVKTRSRWYLIGAVGEDAVFS